MTEHHSIRMASQLPSNYDKGPWTQSDKVTAASILRPTNFTSSNYDTLRDDNITSRSGTPGCFIPTILNWDEPDELSSNSHHPNTVSSTASQAMVHPLPLRSGNSATQASSSSMPHSQTPTYETTFYRPRTPPLSELTLPQGLASSFEPGEPPPIQIQRSNNHHLMVERIEGVLQPTASSDIGDAGDYSACDTMPQPAVNTGGTSRSLFARYLLFVRTTCVDHWLGSWIIVIGLHAGILCAVMVVAFVVLKFLEIIKFTEWCCG